MTRTEMLNLPAINDAVFDYAKDHYTHFECYPVDMVMDAEGIIPDNVDIHALHEGTDKNDPMELMDPKTEIRLTFEEMLQVLTPEQKETIAQLPPVAN